VRDIRSSVPHFTDEDPDEPEPTCDDEHDDVSREIQETVSMTTVTHDETPFESGLTKKK
jgi:hypothetical protein